MGDFLNKWKGGDVIEYWKGEGRENRLNPINKN
jgi:hypothetical protein